jgi:DNA mismatch repair ATPase MutS
MIVEDPHILQLLFLFKLIEGVGSSSFGMHVAHLAALPLEVVEHADLILKNFAQQFMEKQKKELEKNAHIETAPCHPSRLHLPL